MTPLQKVAQSVIDRWDSPVWKDQPHTAEFIAELRKAQGDELAQSVEPVLWITDIDDPIICKTEFEAATFCEDEQRPIPVYLHPQSTTPVPEGYVLVPIEPTEKMVVDLMCTGLRHAEYKPGCDPTIAHMAQGYTAMLAAAQGEKP